MPYLAVVLIACVLFYMAARGRRYVAYSRLSGAPVKAFYTHWGAHHWVKRKWGSFGAGMISVEYTP